jgi:Domain of unknown function (DUF4404)
MTQETINQIRNKIEKSDSIKKENKQELLRLVSILQTEIEELAATDSEHAESILGMTHASAHEATRKEKKPDLYKLSLDGLSESVRGFENSHPKLVEIVNSIATAFSNLGI